MAKSPEEMALSMIQNLPEKTGKSLEEWLQITRASGLEKARSDSQDAQDRSRDDPRLRQSRGHEDAPIRA